MPQSSDIEERFVVYSIRVMGGEGVKVWEYRVEGFRVET
jgi:hypothetical protein